MKTVVFIMAATVLLLISMANHENQCGIVKSSRSVPPHAENPADTSTKINTSDDAASGNVLNLSGKSMNFFLVTF